MEQFKRSLKVRIRLMSVVILICVAIVVVSRFVEIGQIESEFISGFQLGLFIGIEAIFVSKMVKYRRALADEELLKKLYVEETDERRVFIATKTATLSFHVVLSAIGVASIVAGFFDMTVFITLLGVLVFVALTKLVMKVYHRHKF